MRPPRKTHSLEQHHQHPSSPPPLTLLKHTQGSQVLLIDSDQARLARYQQALKQASIAVHAARPSAPILTLLQNHMYDLVLLDLEPHHPEPLAVLEQIRQHTPEVPIVVIAEGVDRQPASQGSPATRDTAVLDMVSRAVTLGIQGLLFAPVETAHLSTTVVEVLKKHRRDTSTRWQMVQQLIQTEKLATVGRLVSSVAHEMNNPLQALYSSLNLLDKRSLDERKRQQYQRMAQEEVENLISVVRRMLDSHRPSLEGMRPTNLNNLLEGVLRLLDRTLHKRKVRVLRDWGPRLPLVLAVSSRLTQVCLSLIMNAIEAMPNGGVLTIRTYTTSEQSPYYDETGGTFRPATTTTSAGPLLHGPAVVIEVSDTGSGIAAEDLPRIFEPFYTTRFNAAGLGLSISYSIVEQHQGQLSVSSTEGQGTTFRVRLPIAP